MITWLLILGGLAVLTVGAESLVRGSAALALRLGLSPLVVGLTVVAFGTSSPELVVSLKSALAGQGNIATGNVVGSNIFNIAIILGLTVLICPIKISMQLIRLDTPIMIGSAFLLVFLLRDFRIEHWEGLMLLTLLALYLTFSIWASRRESKKVEQEFIDELPPKNTPVWLNLIYIVGGLAGLILGGHFFVQGAIALAKSWGVSDAVIGLTVVAAGTSMPELATSIIAALRKNPDIAIGNVVGSNIFNILAILGLASTVVPLHSPDISRLDLGIMVGLSLLLLPIMRTGFVLQRWEGALLVSVYGGYLWFLWPS